MTDCSTCTAQEICEFSPTTKYHETVSCCCVKLVPWKITCMNSQSCWEQSEYMETQGICLRF